MDLKSKDITGFYSAWNKGVRRCLCLSYNAHRFLLPQLLNLPSLETQLMKRFYKQCKNDSVSFMFKLCISKATSLISRNLFYISSIYKVKVKDILNGHVKLIEQDYNEEQVGQTEFLRKMLEMRDKVHDINSLNYNKI